MATPHIESNLEKKGWCRFHVLLRDLVSFSFLAHVTCSLMFNSVTVVSVLRLHSLVYFDIPTKNPTQDLVKICIWSSLELNLGTVGLCAPSMRLLLAHTAHLMRHQTRKYGFYSVHTLTIRDLKGEVLVEEVVRNPAPERYKGGSAGFEEASSRYYAGSVQTICSRNQGNEQP